MGEVAIVGYRPGAIGRIVELHADYYHRHWGFGLFFESRVAASLADFLDRFDPARDGFWLAEAGGEIVGGIGIVASGQEPGTARLRWFIVAEGHQGRGIGSRLMAEAMGFCRRTGVTRITLSTFAGLHAARHLYEQWGFVLTGEGTGTQWGVPVTEQTFVAEP